MNKERISIDSQTYHEDIEYRFENLKFKVVKFAMDKIRTNMQSACSPDFQSRGDDCDCWDRIEYKLPCACVIHANPGVLPLGIIDGRWMFERDESMYKNAN